MVDYPLQVSNTMYLSGLQFSPATASMLTIRELSVLTFGDLSLAVYE